MERIRECLDREGPLLPILHALQDEFGYVPQAAVPMIAEALNLSRAEVHGVVTFYHDFRREPAGRHVLKLCRAEACQAMGGDALAAQRRSAGSASSSARPPPTAASRWSRSIASASAPARRRRCSTASVVGRLDATRLDALLAEAQR